VLYLQYEEADPLVKCIIGMLKETDIIPIADTVDIDYVRNTKSVCCITLSGTTDDICLIADAHRSPYPFMGKVARKVGMIRRAEKFQFDPAVYDTLLVFSRYTKDTITRLYPRIKNKVHLCRLPFAPYLFAHDSTSQNNCNDIVFIQTFRAESMHILEVYLGGLLVKWGFKVSHLFCSDPNHYFARTEKALMQEGEKRGMEFVFLPNAEAYYTCLGKAGVVVALDWRACPSHLLAAAALGVVPVAPHYGAYPELIPWENLYPPLNTEEILAMVHSPPVGRICWEKHNPHELALEFLEKAGISCSI
jgi:hypothetical protein